MYLNQLAHGHVVQTMIPLVTLISTHSILHDLIQDLERQVLCEQQHQLTVFSLSDRSGLQVSSRAASSAKADSPHSCVKPDGRIRLNVVGSDRVGALVHTPTRLASPGAVRLYIAMIVSKICAVQCDQLGNLFELRHRACSSMLHNSLVQTLQYMLASY